MSDLFSFTGRKAIVTGASRGIGLAIAQELAQRGARVVITGRKPDTLEKAAAQVQGPSGPAIPVPCHQGEPAAIQALFDRLDRDEFTADVVIVNAATNPVYGPLLDTELGAWQKIVEVNLTGSLLMAQQAARRMKALKKGTIVLVASVAGLDPMPGLGAYSISKAGLIGMAKALSKELGQFGIRVNALAPGLVETKFSAALLQDRNAYERIMATIPLGRHGQPRDIVGAAVFLASEASAYMTGQALVVDGGGRV